MTEEANAIEGALSAAESRNRMMKTLREDWRTLQAVLFDPWELPDGRVLSGKKPLKTATLTERALSSRLHGEDHQPSQQLSVGADRTSYELNLEGMGLGDLGGSSSLLASLPQLRKLSLAQNLFSDSAIVNDGIRMLVELRELDVNYNRIEKLSCPSSNVKLEVVSASGNGITQVGDWALPKLQSLDLSANRISAIPEKSLRLPSLTHLDVSNNALQSLAFLAPLLHLEILNVRGNALTSLSGIETLSKLLEMDASHNRLRPGALSAHTNPLKSLSNLTSLDVSHNEISTLAFFPPGGMPSVTELNLAANKFHGDKKSEPVKTTAEEPCEATTPVDDIGDAEYGDEETCASSVAASTSRGQQQQQRAARASMLKKRKSTTLAVKEKRPQPLQQGNEASEGTLLARLAALFPGLEILDLSHNSSQLISDYSELRALARCPNLTELKLKSTLHSDDPSFQQQHNEAVAAYLPRLEVLDGTVLKSFKPAAVASLGGAVGRLDGPVERKAPRPSSARGGGQPLVRPQSASARPSSARARPSSAAGRLSTEASATSRPSDALQDFNVFLHQMEAMREKCNRVLNYMSAQVEWAAGKAPMPDATMLVVEDKKGASEVQGVQRNIEEETQKKLSRIASAPPQTMPLTAVAKQTTPTKPAEAPTSRSRARSSEMRLGSGHRTSSTPGNITAALREVRRAQGLKVAPTSFASERAKFEQQLRMENEQRWAEVLSVAGPPQQKQKSAPPKKEDRAINTHDSFATSASALKVPRIAMGKVTTATSTPPLVDIPTGEGEYDDVSPQRSDNVELVRPSSRNIARRGEMGRSYEAVQEPVFIDVPTTHNDFPLKLKPFVPRAAELRVSNPQSLTVGPGGLVVRKDTQKTAESQKSAEVLVAKSSSLPSGGGQSLNKRVRPMK